MLENKKAVIFDLDGTLVDSMWIWREIDIRFLGKYGLEVPQGLNWNRNKQFKKAGERLFKIQWDFGCI